MLNSRIQRKSSKLREDFLLHALHGSVNLESEEEDNLLSGNIKFISSIFGVILIKVENINEEKVSSIET